MQRLLAATDLVLMDLRTFSRRNAGCEFELEQLLRRLPTDRVVCDQTTDLHYLHLVLSNAWAAALRDGMNRGEARLTVCHAERQSARELRELLDTLVDASGLDADERSLPALAASA